MNDMLAMQSFLFRYILRCQMQEHIYPELTVFVSDNVIFFYFSLSLWKSQCVALVPEFLQMLNLSGLFPKTSRSTT